MYQPKEEFMKRSMKTTATLGIASAILLALGVSGAWANEPGYGREGYGGNGHGAMRSHGMGMMHRGAGHLVDELPHGSARLVLLRPTR